MIYMRLLTFLNSVFAESIPFLSISVYSILVFHIYNNVYARILDVVNLSMVQEFYCESTPAELVTSRGNQFSSSLNARMEDDLCSARGI